MTGDYDLVAVGEVLLDVVVPALGPGRLQHGPVQLRPGGSPVNAARAAARLGRSALVVGCVGDDPLGRLLLDELAGEPFDSRVAIVSGAPTGRGVFAGTAAVVQRGANAAFAPEHVPEELRPRAVLVSGYQLLRDDAAAGAAAALRLGGLVGVDLGSPRLVERFGSDRLRALLADVDVVFGSPDAVAAAAPPASTLAVETLGAEGARAEGLHARPPQVVDGDLLGAGDAFAAAFLLARADGASVAEALDAACAAGAASGNRVSRR